MAALHYPLEIYRGDTAAWTFLIWEDEDKTTPVDLTGADIAAEIRVKPGRDPAIAFDVTVTPPNEIDCLLTATKSALLPLIAVWDLQATFPDGNVETFVAGPVLVTPDVTGSAPLVAPA